MKKQGRLILVIVLLLIVVIFSWLNVRNVTVSFGFTKVTMPLVILIGAIIAASLSVSTIMSQKKKINELEKSLKANQTMRRTDASTTSTK